MTLRGQSNPVVSSSFVPAGHRLGGGRTFRGQHLSSKQGPALLVRRSLGEGGSKRSAPAVSLSNPSNGPALSLSKGFTLVELLIGATLSAAVMAAVLSSYIFIGRNLARLANQQVLETEARRTLANFARDVRLASGLRYPDIWSSTVSYSIGDLTLRSGTSYRCILAHTNQSPPNATYWTTTTYTPDVATTLIIPTGTSSTTVTYIYDRSAGTLTRTPASGTAQVLLRNITTGGLTIRYYDASNNPYTSYVDYLSGIKQISLEFSTQLGTASNGTQTKVYEVASNRLILRNKALLP